MKILIVDDEPAMRDLLKDMMERFGVDEVFESATGQDAIKRFQSVDLDILFLDYYLPDMNGKKVLEKIDCGKTRIVVMTGVAENDTKEECMKAGADEYLVKPFSMGDLRKLIKP